LLHLPDISPRRRLARIAAAPARGRLVVRFNVTHGAAANCELAALVLSLDMGYPANIHACVVVLDIELLRNWGTLEILVWFADSLQRTNYPAQFPILINPMDDYFLTKKLYRLC